MEKWKSRDKVWEKLEKGGIAKYIAKIHNFDLEVTNRMVKTWKEGKVKVNSVYFQVTKDVIVAVSEILAEGFKFFRDKKLSMNMVNDFVIKFLKC